MKKSDVRVAKKGDVLFVACVVTIFLAMVMMTSAFHTTTGAFNKGPYILGKGDLIIRTRNGTNHTNYSIQSSGGLRYLGIYGDWRRHGNNTNTTNTSLGMSSGGAAARRYAKSVHMISGAAIVSVAGGLKCQTVTKAIYGQSVAAQCPADWKLTGGGCSSGGSIYSFVPSAGNNTYTCAQNSQGNMAAHAVCCRLA